jgi:hypothetical protein
MINSTYNPLSVAEFDKSKMAFNGQKVKAIVPAGTVMNIDLPLTDDHLITGAMINLDGNVPGDEIKFHIVHPVYGIVNTFINWYAADFNKEIPYPAKLPAGLIIRIAYTSTGTADVNIYANFSLHKVLV